MAINPIHVAGTPENDSVQAIDIRLYFPVEGSREAALDMISEALQNSPDLCDLVSAYELGANAFGVLVPDDKPLA
jgi:hypothetical protein